MYKFWENVVWERAEGLTKGVSQEMCKDITKEVSQEMCKHLGRVVPLGREVITSGKG